MQSDHSVALVKSEHKLRVVAWQALQYYLAQNLQLPETNCSRDGTCRSSSELVFRSGSAIRPLVANVFERSAVEMLVCVN